jgi:tripartite-type tricarboxylate transporter receptor subunit TctC
LRSRDSRGSKSTTGGIARAGRHAAEVVTKLYEETAKSLKLPDVVERLTAVGTDPVGSTPEECTVFIEAEIAKWGKVIKQSGAKAD